MGKTEVFSIWKGRVASLLLFRILDVEGCEGQSKDEVVERVYIPYPLAERESRMLLAIRMSSGRLDQLGMLTVDARLACPCTVCATASRT